MTNQFLSAALDYAARGWHVFPLKPGDKVPATRTGFKDATTDPEQIRQWWSKNPRYNIGIATGAVSDIVAVDTDNPEAEEYATLQGDVETLSQATAKGRHRLYQYTGHDVRNATRLHGVAGLDVRGDGGYIVAAPSVHPSGVVYSWENDNGLAPLPAWVTRKPEQVQAAHRGSASASDRYAETAFNNELAELARSQNGSRNDMLFKAARRVNEFVLAGRLPASAVEQLGTVARGLGLPDKEIVATLASARNGGEPEYAGLSEHSRTNGTQPPAPQGSGTDSSRGSEDARTRIMVNDLDIPIVVKQAWDALMQQQQQDLTLFHRGGVLVELTSEEGGGRAIARANNARLRGAMARACVFERERERRKKIIAEVVPPPDCIVNDAQVYLDARVPPLERLVNTPVFGRAGELLASAGYHPGARIYHDPAPGIPDMPDAEPTPEQVEQARALIMDDLLGDFPFVDDADKAHAVALLLLPFVRAMIPGPTPLHMIEAPTMGSGKGLLADVLTSVSTGTPPAPMAEARDDDEWRKRVTSTLLGAPTHIMLDNINRTLDSGALAAALTAAVWSDRLLGASQNVRLPVSCVWLATANNPSMSSEIARRTVRIRIDPRIDRPWLRTGFRHENLRQWARENRGAIVAACITLIRAGLPTGAPGRTLGTFEDWSDVMGRILSGVGIPGFLDNLVKVYDQADTEGQRWRAVVDVWWHAHGSNRVKAAQVFQAATEAEIELDLRGNTEKAQQSAFGKALTRLRDRVIGGYQITQAGTHNRVAEWRLIPVDDDPPGGGVYGSVGYVGFQPSVSPTPHARARARTEEPARKPTEPTSTYIDTPPHGWRIAHAGDGSGTVIAPDGQRYAYMGNEGDGVALAREKSELFTSATSATSAMASQSEMAADDDPITTRLHELAREKSSASKLNPLQRAMQMSTQEPEADTRQPGGLPRWPTQEQINQANSGALSAWVERWAPESWPTDGTISIDQWRELVSQLAKRGNDG